MNLEFAAGGTLSERWLSDPKVYFRNSLTVAECNHFSSVKINHAWIVQGCNVEIFVVENDSN